MTSSPLFPIGVGVLSGVALVGAEFGAYLLLGQSFGGIPVESFTIGALIGALWAFNKFLLKPIHEQADKVREEAVSQRAEADANRRSFDQAAQMMHQTAIAVREQNGNIAELLKRDDSQRRHNSTMHDIAHETVHELRRLNDNLRDRPCQMRAQSGGDNADS